jgi:hypothetical protein
MPRITLQTALSDVLDILDDQDALDDNPDLQGAIACLQALVDGKANTFDGVPIYADHVLVGVEMN